MEDLNEFGFDSSTDTPVLGVVPETQDKRASIAAILDRLAQRPNLTCFEQNFIDRLRRTPPTERELSVLPKILHRHNLIRLPSLPNGDPFFAEEKI